jgi:hypothetical protein
LRHFKRSSSQSHQLVAVCGIEGLRVAPFPVLFSLYVNDSHVGLAHCSSPTCRRYINNFEYWLRDSSIIMNDSKSTAVLFVKTARRAQEERPVKLLWCANPVSGYTSVPWDDSRHTANLVDSLGSNCREGSLRQQAQASP